MHVVRLAILPGYRICQLLQGRRLDRNTIAVILKEYAQGNIVYRVSAVRRHRTTSHVRYKNEPPPADQFVQEESLGEYMLSLSPPELVELGTEFPVW